MVVFVITLVAFIYNFLIILYFLGDPKFYT